MNTKGKQANSLDGEGQIGCFVGFIAFLGVIWLVFKNPYQWGGLGQLAAVGGAFVAAFVVFLFVTAILKSLSGGTAASTQKQARTERAAPGKSAVDLKTRTLDAVLKQISSMDKLDIADPSHYQGMAGSLKDLLGFGFRIKYGEFENSTFNSQFGGLPALPAGSEWPASEGRPLAMIAQYNLADIGAAFPQSPLPKNGMLVFFYDLEKTPSCLDEDAAGGWRVVHVKKEVPYPTLPKAPDGLPQSARLPKAQMLLKPMPSVPDHESPEVMLLKLEGKQVDNFESFRNIVTNYFVPDDHPLHQFLGHAAHLQGDRRELVEIERRKKLKLSALEGDSLLREASKLVLLLQVDADSKLNLELVSAGRLFFWIHQDDLAKRNFDATMVDLQYT